MHLRPSFFEILMRTIGALFLFCLFALAGSGPAFCYGAVAVGDFVGSGAKIATVVNNVDSYRGAIAKAIEACRANSMLRNCALEISFTNEWVAVFTPTDEREPFIATGNTREDATTAARYKCRMARHGECGGAFLNPPLFDRTVIDVQPLRPPPSEITNPIPPPVREAQKTTTEPTPQTPPVTFQRASPSIAPAQPLPIQKPAPSIVVQDTGIIEFRYLTYLSFGILALLFMWLLWALSIRTPPTVLRTYLLVAAWTGVPLLFALAGQSIGFDGSPQRYVWNVLAPAFVQLYALVYLLLYIGNRLRMTIRPHATLQADHVFLRLPALTAVIPTALALYAAQHQWKYPEEIIVCSFLAAVVFGVGFFIRPYQIAAPAAPVLVETLQVEEQQAAIDIEVEPVRSNSLPAVIPQDAEVLEPMPPLEGIILKLKRSQKTNAMGKIIYMLDARIDASQETLHLISRHSLGGRLIYESEARQKHAANAQGHLANTRGGPSLLAPASEQAMGAAKTMWKLGRAAVSAVRASLALRITVNGLLSGVHVECKDMDELLEAEDAIRKAKENLEGYIEAAKTFDGREEIH
jgi:hypothetical protein